MLKRLSCTALLAVFCAVLSPVYSFAQTAHWFDPGNVGIPYLDSASAGRYDDVYFISHDTGILVSSFGVIFKTTDGAANWEVKLTTGPDVYFRSIEFTADGQVGIAGSLTGDVYRSTDRGETWLPISSSVPDTAIIHGKRICGLAHYGNNNFYGVGWWGSTTARFYKSADAGNTWTTSYLDTTLATGLVDIVFLTANKGFASGCRVYNGGLKQESVVLRTLDGGTSWTKVFSDTTFGGRIWKLQFLDASQGFGSIEPEYRDTVAMIKTTDGGNTWQVHPAGHIHAWTYGWGTQGVGFVNSSKGWLGGYYNGMYETNDGGLTWDTVSANDECNRFFLVDSTMYVSGSTVFKYGHEASEGIGTAHVPLFLHKLYPISPNPATGKVHIEFDINAHQVNTVLKVINTDGRTSYPVISGFLKPGHYSYYWDGTHAPPGNYIVWLGTDEIPLVQRFVLK